MRLTHHIAWELIYGPIPKGKMVLHRCDVRDCCRPTHLWLGTHRENMEDMRRKGRSGKKLTQEQVDSMRYEWSAGWYQRALAKRYGCSQSMVSRIVNRKTRT